MAEIDKVGENLGKEERKRRDQIRYQNMPSLEVLEPQEQWCFPLWVYDSYLHQFSEIEMNDDSIKVEELLNDFSRKYFTTQNG